MSAHVRDEHGNPIQLTDQHGNPVYLTDERGRPMHLTGVATAVGSSDVVVTHEYDTAVIKQRPEEPYQQHQLNRSGSSSSSSVRLSSIQLGTMRLSLGWDRSGQHNFDHKN